MTQREDPDGSHHLLGSADRLHFDGTGIETRAAAIHRSIRRAVMEQKLPPGTRLPEDQIGGIFGASRTLVRAALLRLVHDGIVSMSRNRGAFVASPSIDEARQVFEARRVVESVTVARAAGVIEPAEVAMLEELLERGVRARLAGDRGTAIRLSGDFHVSVSAAARQQVFQSFLVELVSRSSLVIALYGRGYDSACGDDEHHGILDALGNRDAARASELMIAHLDHIEADLDLTPSGARALSLADALIVVDDVMS